MYQDIFIWGPNELSEQVGGFRGIWRGVCVWIRGIVMVGFGAEGVGVPRAGRPTGELDMG